jgi:signal transduction histidine kinase
MTDKEKSLYDIHELFLNIGLKGKQIEKLGEVAVVDIMGYGTTFDEKILSVDDLFVLIQRQNEQSAGLDMDFDFTPVLRRFSADENTAVLVDELVLKFSLNAELVRLFLRFSIVYEYINQQWKAIHWHGSKPLEIESEKDTFGLEEWKQKTAELEKLVEQRTIDLLNKNLELEAALAQLKATQTQLIHSEKMASLGELTAGIAHEIQNPLNFVNNFSEVNRELLLELKSEIQLGNIDDVKSLADDIIINEEKINHHGKRADTIVKGMLQHSRSAGVTKEPTDINKLADEYLRLAYHGLRAKDNSFNAILKTDFNEEIGNIKIVPQDIGRVIMNLINNAFYAVDEKKKSLAASASEASYEPTVSISTKRIGNNVEISIADNGNGITEAIREKIFQPFFTTKPTGQGTGLGLSLSYDIIKAHGGEIRVNSEEGLGSEFVIVLKTEA